VYKVHILIHKGKRGRGRELAREKVRGAMVHKAGQKYQHDSFKYQQRGHVGFGVFIVN
jgi:hypothetical protein